MRKYYCYLLLGIFMVTLITGCGSVDSFIEKKMLEKSGVLEEESYIIYRNQVESNNVDEEGYYFQKSEDSEEKGVVHVTFATNTNLNIKYYADEEHSIAIDTSSCYLNPSDIVYADVLVSKKVNSPMYEFSSFKISEYDDEGEKTCISELDSDFLETGIVLHIPSDYEGTEISVEPIGRYRKREIVLKDYYIEDGKNGEETEHNLDGTWLIDDLECTDDLVEVSPISSYVVSYQYDSNEYFCVSTEPECYYNDSMDGTVIFSQQEVNSETDGYSVELHKYISASVHSSVGRTVKVNSEAGQEVKAGTEFLIPKLKYGDKVRVETDQEWEELKNSSNSLFCTNIEQLSDDLYVYSLTVPEKDGEFIFNPADYTFEHGTLTFKWLGTVVTDVKCLAKGSVIYYEEQTADEGYWLPGGEHYIVVGEEEETKQQLTDICFTKKTEVSVSLGQPTYGGKIVYYIGGKEITSSEVKTYSGTKISMDFEPWEGWKCDRTDGTQYSTTESSNQFIDGENIFSEDNEHKPELTVVIEKSVGQDMLFAFSAPGLNVNEANYEGTWYKNDYKIIDSHKIGTEKGITISMKNKAIPSGKAIKIIVKRTDADKNDNISEVRYIDDLTQLQEPINIYSDPESDTVWYRSLDITISIVDVSPFVLPKAGEYSIVTVKNMDTMKVLVEGDLIEPSQKVGVTISPNIGYYVSGGNVSNDTIYQETLKYSKYISKIDQLISTHPALKFCEVTLDESDAYASYTYKCGKENLSGKVRLKQGEKVTLEYEIIGAGYRLKETAGGFLGIGKTNKKVKASIEIVADYDGKTITRSEFGIEVVEAE